MAAARSMNDSGSIPIVAQRRPDEPVKVTTAALRSVVAFLRDAWPKEGCGFLAGPEQEPFADRWIAMENVDPDPTKGYIMRDGQIARVYKGFDDRHLEPRAVVHSHPHTAPIMSERDITAAADLSLAYIVVSFETGQPKARAYRLSSAAVGVKQVTEVRLVVGSPEALTAGPPMPLGPWVLHPGNRVQVTYRRSLGTETQYTVTGTVERLTDSEVAIRSGRELRPVALGRLVHVALLAEGEDAQRVRREMIAHLRQAANSLSAGGAIVEVPRLAAVAAAAYPTYFDLEIVEEN